MKRVFITGGAGFVGSAIVNLLYEKKYDIAVYDNLSFGSLDFIPKEGIKFFKGDILDEDKLIDCLHSYSPHYVLHLAAIHFIPYCNANPFEASNINIKGTMNVLKACQSACSLEKFFFASTAAVYPVFDLAINEEIAPNPTDIYGLSKLVGEDLVRKFHIETRISSIVCRFFNAFGPNETNPHLIPEIQNQIKGGKRSLYLGNTNPKRDFIHTFDMAEAVWLLLERFQKDIEIFNLGSGKEYSVVEVVSAFEKCLYEKLEIFEDPLKIRKIDRLHLLADIRKIKAITGWQPKISLEQGIETLM